MLHEAAPPADALMKLPAEFLGATGPTSFVYRFAA